MTTETRVAVLPIDPRNLTSVDLRHEAELLLLQGTACEAYHGAVSLPRGGTHAEAVEALYVPGCGRIGIAWGADADWCDADSAEAGIREWSAGLD